MADLRTHHLIYGTMTDFLTGDSIVDTDDERYRQEIARFMVQEKGYAKEELIPRLRLETLFNKNFVTSTIDLTVCLLNRYFMIVRYGPGSLVTRERPAVAAARVLNPDYQIPYAVVTNGENAEFLTVDSAKVLARGMDKIPGREQALDLIKEAVFLPPPTAKRREQELRILNVFDQEICCTGGPCAIPSAPEG